MKKISIPILFVLLLGVTLINLSITVQAYECCPAGCESAASDACDTYCGPWGGCEGVYMADSWCVGSNDNCNSIWWIFCIEMVGYGKYYCAGKDYTCP